MKRVAFLALLGATLWGGRSPMSAQLIEMRQTIFGMD
jgi:hypothetical protein